MHDNDHLILLLKHYRYIYFDTYQQYKMYNFTQDFNSGVSWPSGLVHWTQVLVLSECEFESRPGQSRHLNHNCFVLRMGRKAIAPVCCVMHVKEPRIVPRCFWIRALSTQQGGYMHATNLLYYY